jgi:NAD(P)-dependent dehydrogenase (short-subunit alcohol dehydrogenase family)
MYDMVQGMSHNRLVEYLITGASSGIGRAAALALAGPGTNLVLAGRSEERTQPVIDLIREMGGEARHVPLDLASLSSVAAAMESYRPMGPMVLINNAGLTGRGITADGFELAFGVNYLGHYLLTRLLQERSERVVNLASDAHYGAGGIDWAAVTRPTRSLTGYPEYQVSKLCMVLLTLELARRGHSAYAVHPGVVATGMWRRLPQPFRWLVTRGMLTPEQGAKTVVECARQGGPTGRYWFEGRAKEPSSRADDPGLARELWERSEGWVGPYLS